MSWADKCFMYGSDHTAKEIFYYKKRKLEEKAKEEAEKKKASEKCRGWYWECEETALKTTLFRCEMCAERYCMIHLLLHEYWSCEKCGKKPNCMGVFHICDIYE